MGGGLFHLHKCQSFKLGALFQLNARREKKPKFAYRWYQWIGCLFVLPPLSAISVNNVLDANNQFDCSRIIMSTSNKLATYFKTMQLARGKQLIASEQSRLALMTNVTDANQLAIEVASLTESRLFISYVCWGNAGRGDAV